MLTNTLQYWGTLRENLPDREAWQSTAHRLAKSWTRLYAEMQDRFLLVALPQGGLSVTVMQLFGLPEPWWRPVCRDTDCLSCRRYGLSESFFWASGTWQPEGLFGQSFSIAPPVQALRGLPCLGTFSAVRCIRHIDEPPLPGVLLCRSAHQALKGAPWVRSYSTVWCIVCLMGHPLYCSAADARVWGERGYGDGSTRYAWLSSIALFAWLPGFPPQAFPTTVSSLTSPGSISLQPTAALTWRLLHNP